MVRVVKVRIGKRKAYQTGNGVVMSLTNFVEAGKTLFSYRNNNRWQRETYFNNWK